MPKGNYFRTKNNLIRLPFTKTVAFIPNLVALHPKTVAEDPKEVALRPILVA